MGKHLKTMRINGKLASWIVVFSMLLELFSMPSSIAHAAYTEDPTQVEEIVSDEVHRMLEQFASQLKGQGLSVAKG